MVMILYEENVTHCAVDLKNSRKIRSGSKVTLQEHCLVNVLVVFRVSSIWVKADQAESTIAPELQKTLRHLEMSIQVILVFQSIVQD